MRLALLFHLATLHKRATISLILQDISILFEVFLLDTQGHIARARMQEVGRCRNCDGCTRAEEQARLRAVQEAARETERLKAEEASHLCTAESIHPACPLKKIKSRTACLVNRIQKCSRPEQQPIIHASPP